MTDAGSEYGFVNEISEDGGRFCTTTYSVFRGIELIYNDAPDDDALEACKKLGASLA